MRRIRSACCASAASGHAAAPPRSVMTSRRSFDHLVGGHEKPRRHGQAERLCRLDVESWYEFGRRLHRKIGKLCAPQNAVHIERRLPKLVDPIDAVHYGDGSQPNRVTLTLTISLGSQIL